MIKKFFIYCESDGIFSAICSFGNNMCRLFYRKSETVFFVKKADNDILINCISADFVIKEIFIEDINFLEFPRLKLLPIDDWLTKGSRLFVTFYKGYPIGYCWIHFNCHLLSNLCSFLLEENECWIGPDFVHKKFRGRGLQKFSIDYRVALMSGRVCYTCTNKSNIASAKSYFKAGFENVGSIIKTRIFNKSKLVIKGDILIDKAIY